MYRGGWSNLTMLNYYTKKLGMRDSIEKEDLLVGVDKTEMDKEIIKLKAESKESKEIISGILKYIQGGGDHIVFQNDKTGELIGFGKEELPKNAVVKVNNQKTSLS